MNVATVEVSLECPAVSADLCNVKHTPSSPVWILGENLLVCERTPHWDG